MIPNSKVRNTAIPYPVVEGTSHSPFLDKIFISNIYQQWSGQTIKEITENNEDNPFTIRIGLPHTDEHLRNDRIFLITKYLSYNPITKNIEDRQIIPYRNTNTIYIGQTTEEKEYSDYSLFAQKSIVANDIFLRKVESIKNRSVSDIIVELLEKVNKLQAKVNELAGIIQKNQLFISNERVS